MSHLHAVSRCLRGASTFTSLSSLYEISTEQSADLSHLETSKTCPKSSPLFPLQCLETKVKRDLVSAPFPSSIIHRNPQLIRSSADEMADKPNTDAEEHSPTAKIARGRALLAEITTRSTQDKKWRPQWALDRDAQDNSRNLIELDQILVSLEKVVKSPEQQTVFQIPTDIQYVPYTNTTKHS